MKKNTKKLYTSRKILLQNLYGITLNNEHIILHSIKAINKNKINLNYIENLIKKIKEKNTILELIIAVHTKINLCIIEKLILKIAICEIFYNKIVPLKVIINESILLSKTFCTHKSHKIINKILDNLIKNK